MTPPPKRPRLLASGLDSLYVAYSVDVSQGRLDWDDLGYRKERLRRQRHGEFAEITLGSERFALKPHGRKPYSFLLANEQFEIALSEHMQPRCYVQFFSEGLWKLGVNALLERIERWLASMGFRATQPSAVSRADWAFDYDLSGIDFLPDHFVTRAAKKAQWSERDAVQTFQIGTGDVVGQRTLDELRQLVERHPQAAVGLGFDNDEAGQRLAERVALSLNRAAERLLPRSKDWNDDLQARGQRPRTRERQRPRGAQI